MEPGNGTRSAGLLAWNGAEQEAEQGSDERTAFIRQCTGSTKLTTKQQEAFFGGLYDEMQRKQALGITQSIGASVTIDLFTDGGNYAGAAVDLIASSLRPRIDAIVDWNAPLLSGFQDISTKPRKPATARSGR